MRVSLDVNAHEKHRAHTSSQMPLASLPHCPKRERVVCQFVDMCMYTNVMPIEAFHTPGKR